MASVPPPDYNPASLLPNVAADITTIRGGGFSLDYIGGAGLNTSTIVKFSPGNTSTMITHTSTNSFITVSKEPYELTDPRVKPVRTKPVPGFEEAMLITGDKAKVAQLDTKVITGLTSESIDPICLTDKGVILNSRCAAHSAASAAALGRIVKDDIKKENAKTNYFKEFELSEKPSDFKATTSRKIVDMRYDTDKKQLFLDYEDGDKFYRFYGRSPESLLELLNNKFSVKANAGVGDKPKNTNKTLTVTPKPPADAKERINNYGKNVGTLFSNAKEMEGKYPEVNKENKKLYPADAEYNKGMKNKDIIEVPDTKEAKQGVRDSTMPVNGIISNTNQSKNAKEMKGEYPKAKKGKRGTKKRRGSKIDL